MSGHSKWATTKRKKAKIDQARAKIFNRIIRELTVAAKHGGSDQDSNAKLRAAVLKAKSANMPSKNIETAIAKGANELEGVNYFELTYEGYGPGGIAILVDALTDNKTRTVANIRHIFSRNGGNMGESGCVAYMFQSKGYFSIPKDQIPEDRLMEIVLDAGAEDLQVGEEEYEVYCKAEHFEALGSALSQAGLKPENSEITKIADLKIKLAGEVAQKSMKLLEALDDDDDVQNVSTNAEFDEKEFESE